jgi:uncharacterized protein
VLTRLSLPLVRAALRLKSRPQERLAGLAATSFDPPLKVNLLVLQATPFCNIDCSYCYLPDRDSLQRMDPAVMQAAIHSIADSGMLGDTLRVVWHSGEPLVAGHEFYRRAFACIDQAIAGRCVVQHSFQTNAMLIDRNWCDLFAEHHARVGVSIDGPEHIHDRHRRTRDGKGTHAKAMRGVACLLERGLPFHAIAVVTAASLEYADEIFDFFRAAGFQEVGFNIDEREGVHRESSIGPREELQVERFLARMLELSTLARGRPRIRELEEARQAILRGLPPVKIGGRAYPGNSQVVPFDILSVDHAGNFSTFSPELLGQPAREHGDFVFGNVLTDPIASAFSDPRFLAVYAQINAGVERCRRECDYFELCGGGAPANKLYENGSFESAETSYCRSVVIAPIRIALADLERQFGQEQPQDPFG